MAQGGYRMGAGRRQEQHALDTSRRRRTDTVELPAEGRTDPPPSWPLPRNKKHEAMWSRLWRKPQALEWERLDLGDQVASYVVAYCDSTAPGAPAALKTAALRMEDGLGISPTGLAALRWRIVEAATEPEQVSAVIDARSRFQAAVAD